MATQVFFTIVAVLLLTLAPLAVSTYMISLLYGNMLKADQSSRGDSPLYIPAIGRLGVRTVDGRRKIVSKL